MLQIVHAISPRHLRVLHLRLPSASRSLTLIPAPFPALVDLRIEGPMRHPEFLPNSPTAPALERLYIGSAFVTREEFGDVLKRICPNLTHLRMKTDGDGPAEDPYLRFLHTYCRLTRPLSHMVEAWSRWPPQPELDDTDDWTPVAVDDTSVPPFLRRIVIEFFQSVIPDIDEILCGHGSEQYEEHMEAYHKLAKEAKKRSGVGEVEDEMSGGRSLLVLEEPPDIPEAQYKQYATDRLAQAKKEWLEISTGTGPGCWTRVS